MTDEQQEQQIDLVYCTRKELQQRYEASVYTNTPLVIEHLALWPYRSAEGLKTWDGDYSHMELDGLVAHGAVLELVRLVQSRLVGVDLTGALANPANCWKANFTRAILNGVNFAASNLQDVTFNEAQMKDVCLVGADASGAHFDETDLTGAQLSGCILVGATFREANLTNVDFSGATLTGANFSRAILTGANFEYAGLIGVRLFQTVYTQGQFDKTKLVHLIDMADPKYSRYYYEDDEEGYL
jgi:uncharacterized protein YjbI with pentapeptide repeats